MLDRSQRHPSLPTPLTHEGPEPDEGVRIIGVELTVANRYEGVQRELEMFKCQHTLRLPRDGYNAQRTPESILQDQFWATITLHTSLGDIQYQGPMGPNRQHIAQ